MRILISGAGIAGPTLAYWFQNFGHSVTIVEQSPRLRTGGYVVDFWGAGYDVAEKMGLTGGLNSAGYKVENVRIVGKDGKRVSGFPVKALLGLSDRRFVSIPRGDLGALIYDSLGKGVETLFGDSVSELRQVDSGVDVCFEHGVARRFDLVVGADGLHSRIRNLAFGPDSMFEKYLGYKVAAFTCQAYPHRDELTYVMYTMVHQQVGRFAMRDGRTMFLFIFADNVPDRGEAHNLESQKSLLHERFDGCGWECKEILAALDETDDLYFDRVSQIRMPGSWSNGRVALLGDAAYCVSLLAGEGSSLAMAGAYILAGELARAAGDYERAFEAYQRQFAPFVADKQKGALTFADYFAPRSKWRMFAFNQVIKLLNIPWIAKRLVARSFGDKLQLPDYVASSPKASLL